MKNRNYLVPVWIENKKLAQTIWYQHPSAQSRATPTKELVPNFEIELTLRLQEIFPTRGSFRAQFSDEDDFNYYMLGSDFNYLLAIKETVTTNNSFEVRGVFTVSNRASDYTLRLVNPTKDGPLDIHKMETMLKDRINKGTADGL